MSDILFLLSIIAFPVYISLEYYFELLHNDEDASRVSLEFYLILPLFLPNGSSLLQPREWCPEIESWLSLCHYFSQLLVYSPTSLQWSSISVSFVSKESDTICKNTTLHYHLNRFQWVSLTISWSKARVAYSQKFKKQNIYSNSSAAIDDGIPRKFKNENIYSN